MASSLLRLSKLSRLRICSATSSSNSSIRRFFASKRADKRPLSARSSSMVDSSLILTVLLSRPTDASVRGIAGRAEEAARLGGQLDGRGAADGTGGQAGRLGGCIAGAADLASVRDSSEGTRDIRVPGRGTGAGAAT
eukprot:CAMPEP_0180560256 /NCGR_PEP_ID=MMETSP1037_2-20121125/2739_1 /TAXON_ID=632150 /ORGANISM="Azadinium spinosum, Strain 3D9" /LENGTH=136 /DNA_ID=CAMNT_0022576795 /DNA_START=686 /DNA_END=1092 /DNA_ORIENTATION=+